MPRWRRWIASIEAHPILPDVVLGVDLLLRASSAGNRARLGRRHMAARSEMCFVPSTDTRRWRALSSAPAKHGSVGTTFQVREASPGDNERAIGLIERYGRYRLSVARAGWAPGFDAHEWLSLVATDSHGAVCGVTGVGQPTAQTWDVLHQKGGRPSIQQRSLWKIGTVAAVDEGHCGGIGRAPLDATVRRLPRKYVGLYGNVELNRTDSIQWYRRQGFLHQPDVRANTHAASPGHRHGRCRPLGR